MNWLAHVFLSENNIDFQIGNFIADPYKAKAWDGASVHINKGMYVHKIIDSFTDSNEYFKQSKKRLKEKGLLRSIVIDLTYDYLLTKNWHKFSSITLEVFLKDFYNKAYNRSFDLPSNASYIVLNLINKNLLKFDDYDDLELAFKRLDRRLSAKLLSRDNALSYMPYVKENIEGLEKDFLQFFPLLMKEVKNHLEHKALDHWKF